MLTLDTLRLDRDTFRLSANLQIEKGIRASVIGASGAGKSTLLAAIAGFHTPTSGRILWDGDDITPLPPADRPLTIVFQDQNLFPHLTTAQNIGLGIRPSLRLSSREQTEIETSLSRVGLAGLGNRRPAELSGGQQSRVVLARALLRARPLMLLDEPFAALGPRLKFEMLDLVVTLAEDTGATILMVTHSPEDALRLGEKTIFIADGDAHQPRDTAELFANPPHALKAYLAEGPGY